MPRPPENFPDLIEHWTLLPAESDLLAGKHDGASKLAFALLLKFYGRYGRFPRGRAELPGEVVEFVAAQAKVPRSDLGFYSWSGRTIERHRAEIRRFFGFRTFTVADFDKLTGWLAGDYAQRVRRPELVREQFLAECRTRQLEPPTPGQIDRLVASALARGAETVAARVAGRLGPAVLPRLHGSGGWRRGPAVLADVAESTGAADLQREREARYQRDRESWRARLRQYASARNAIVAPRDGWLGLDDEDEWAAVLLSRWPVLSDDFVRGPPSAEARESA